MTQSSEPVSAEGQAPDVSRPKPVEDKVYRVSDKLYRMVEVSPQDLRDMQLTPEEAVKPEPLRAPVHHHDHTDDHDHDFDGHHDHDHPDEVIEL